MSDSRFTVNELLFFKSELTENKYTKDGKTEERRALLDKIEKIIQRKVEGK